MSLDVVKQPIININGQSSKWNSVHQPVIFELQRRDFNLVYQQKVSGYVRLKIMGTIPSVVKVGHRLKFRTLGKVNEAKITQIIQPNVIVTDSTINGTVYTGDVIFSESYKNYYVEVEVFGVDKSDNYISLGTSRNTSGKDEIAKISIQEWLRTLTTFENEFAYNALNKAMKNEGGKFNIRYREVYNGVATAYSSLSTLNVFYWTNSVKQLQEKHGQNMADFVPMVGNVRDEGAKFQSVFKRPTYFVGYPFSLNFIYSDNLLNYQLIKKEKTKNVNGSQIAVTSDNLSMAQRVAVNRLMLKGSYTSNVKTVDVWLEYGDVNTDSALGTGVIFTESVFNPFTPLDAVRVPLTGVELMP
jgi:hypothetical protein